jgi:hypothetical protein
MEMAMEKPAKHSADSHRLPYRVAALLVFVEACDSKGLPADVVD